MDPRIVLKPRKISQGRGRLTAREENRATVESKVHGRGRKHGSCQPTFGGGPCEASRSYHRPVRPFLLMLLSGCVTDPADPLPFVPPLDDQLRFDHIQALGTHNSYHVDAGLTDRPEWAYSHLPIDRQAAEQGVRQFEFDLTYDEEQGDFRVVHVPYLDPGTTCDWLTDCAADLKVFSDDHPLHHPLVVLIEVKDGWDDGVGPARLDELDVELRSVWPDDRLVRPVDVQGTAASLAEAVATVGWPTLGALRGKALFVLHTGADWRRAYTEDDSSVGERPLFADGGGDLSVPVAAFDVINDPIGDAGLIAEAAALGHLVRTRADGDNVQAVANDPTQRDAAFSSDAHFVSTDWPSPHPDTGYVVAVPGGNPSRCHPTRAPTECGAGDIEDLASWEGR